MNAESLIRNFWHFGCHQSEIPKEGDFIKFDLLDTTVVLYNDGAGIIAFDNICPHRGARFFDTSHGHAIATCKYHGWTQSRGQLLISNRAEFSDCPQSLNKFQIELCGGFIFFAIDPISNLEDQLTAPLYSIIEEISFDSENRTDFDHYTYECNWAVAVENALEPDHVPFIHSNTLARLELTDNRNEFFGKNSVVTFRIGNERARRGLEKINRYFILGNQRFEGYRSIHLYPFGFISSTFGNSYSIQNFFPKSADLTDFSSRLYFPSLSENRYEEVVGAFKKSTSEVNRTVFTEDHDICKRISSKAWQAQFDGPLSNTEVKIARFRDSLRQYF